MTTNDSTTKPHNQISLANEEGVRKVVTEAVFGLWDVVNHRELPSTGHVLG